MQEDERKINDYTRGGCPLYKIPQPGDDPIFVHPDSYFFISLGEEGSGRDLVKIPIWKRGHLFWPRRYVDTQLLFLERTDRRSPDGEALVIINTFLLSPKWRGRLTVENLRRGEIIAKGVRAFGRSGTVASGEELLVKIYPGGSFTLRGKYTVYNYFYQQDSWTVVPEGESISLALLGRTEKLPEIPESKTIVGLRFLSKDFPLSYFASSYPRYIINHPHPHLPPVPLGVWLGVPEERVIYSALLVSTRPFLQLIPLYFRAEKKRLWDLVLIHESPRYKVHPPEEAETLMEFPGREEGEKFILIKAPCEWWGKVARLTRELRKEPYVELGKEE